MQCLTGENWGRAASNRRRILMEKGGKSSKRGRSVNGGRIRRHGVAELSNA